MLGAHDLGDGAEQARKVARALDLVVLEVVAPDTRVLADQHDLAHAAGHEFADLGEDALGRTRAVAAANVRDHAEAAEAVAAVRDLHVGRRALDRALDARDVRSLGALDAQHLVHDGHDAVLLVGGHERRHLGQLGGQVVAVARGNAAAHDDLAGAHAVLDLGGELERGLDALGRGRGEERARVHDRDVGLLGARRLAIARRAEQRAHAVGVDLVLGAAKRDVDDRSTGVFHEAARLLSSVSQSQRIVSGSW